MKPQAFDYIAADSIAMAVAALAQAGDDAKIIAGGQSLVPMLNFRMLRPSILVDINRIAGLDAIAETSGAIHVGVVPLLASWGPIDVKEKRDGSASLYESVFQNKTVLEIVRAVLEPYSILLSIETSASYENLEYCTQYRETDLNFVLRLLQQHGVFFYFTHTVSDHRLVLSDDSSRLSACPVLSEFPYRLDGEGRPSFYVPHVSIFSSRASLIPGEPWVALDPNSPQPS